MVPKIFQERPEVAKHALSLFLSLLIHGGLFLVLAVQFSSVKVIDFKRKVTDVVIAPIPKLEAPVSGSVRHLPPVDSEFLEFLPNRARPAREARAILEGTGPSGEHQEAFPGPPIDSKLTTGFRLDRTGPEKQEKISGEEFRLSIPVRQGSVGGSARGTGPRPKNVDFHQYMVSDATGRSGIIAGGAPGRRGRSSIRARAVPTEVRRYDLSPWARRVLEIILKNWTVPEPFSSPDIAVEISCLILRSGEISVVEVSAASSDRDFDQAARAAIELSSPLPRLPDDFPAASLEISFVFSTQR